MPRQSATRQDRAGTRPKAALGFVPYHRIADLFRGCKPDADV